MTAATNHDPPFRAEHVGSLLRPWALRSAGRGYREGAITRAEFDEVLEAAIVEAIRLQEDTGMQAVTDGEFRRGSWFLGFVEAVEGLTTAPALYRFSGGHGAWQCPYAKGRVRRGGGIATGEFSFVRAHTGRTPKVTLPSPTAMVFWRGAECADRSAYPDLDAYYADLAGIYREELAALAGLGCTYVQLDEVPIAMLCDPAVREAVRARGEDPHAVLRQLAALVAEALSGRPSRLTVAMHLCRGNYRGRWLAEGGYDPVAELLFNEIPVDAYFLEYDTDRAGGFAPLRFLPAGKTAVLGLVSTKVPDSPGADTLKARIGEAARVVPLDRLALSPQCGFASSAGGNPISAEDQRAKLRLVAQVAAEVWG